ncbi:uncharacterized protein V1516DRAFT_683315 [Lipomyces oligophaga]|uniref:uncharacterized protein n=1 Tax=Lipomyces oligophaga TaxID=45792 RepID=UPI0034CDEA79
METETQTVPLFNSRMSIHSETELGSSQFSFEWFPDIQFCHSYSQVFSYSESEHQIQTMSDILSDKPLQSSSPQIQNQKDTRLEFKYPFGRVASSQAITWTCPIEYNIVFNESNIIPFYIGTQRLQNSMNGAKLIRYIYFEFPFGKFADSDPINWKIQAQPSSLNLIRNSNLETFESANENLFLNLVLNPAPERSEPDELDQTKFVRIHARSDSKSSYSYPYAIESDFEVVKPANVHFIVIDTDPEILSLVTDLEQFSKTEGIND